MQLAMEGVFNCLVVMKNGRLDHISLEDVVGNNKKIGAASGNTKESNIVDNIKISNLCIVKK